MRRSMLRISDKLRRKDEMIDTLTRAGFVSLQSFVADKELQKVFRKRKLTRREVTGPRLEIEEWVPDWAVRVLYAAPILSSHSQLNLDGRFAPRFDRVLKRCIESTAVKNAVIAAVAAKAPFDFIEAICEEIEA